MQYNQYEFTDKQKSLLIASIHHSLNEIEDKILALDNPEHYYMESLTCTHHSYLMSFRMLAKRDFISRSDKLEVLLERYTEINS